MLQAMYTFCSIISQYDCIYLAGAHPLQGSSTSWWLPPWESVWCNVQLSPAVAQLLPCDCGQTPVGGGGGGGGREGGRGREGGKNCAYDTEVANCTHTTHIKQLVVWFTFSEEWFEPEREKVVELDYIAHSQVPVAHES